MRGQYAVRLFGSIGDQQVDQILEPEEILPASQLQFPEAQPDTLHVQSELQAEIAALNGQVQTARLLGLAGLGLGALALILALIVLLRRR